MSVKAQTLTVIGGGLAGTEAAWQTAQRGIPVILHEMRPNKTTPAHVTDKLAELVCSNSLGSDLPDRAPGLLKAELRRLGSLVIACADETRIPAGGALAVGRERFAELVTERICSHPNIIVHREEVTTIPPGPVIIATGPLTSAALSDGVAALVGTDYLYFFDAMAPIVTAESINTDMTFRASRYGKGQTELGDYINCPLDQSEYERLVDAILSAEQIELRDFERVSRSEEMPHFEGERFFEGCLPIEILAARGRDALAFGPMRPVGLIDPRIGKRPYAVVQLRQDNVTGTLYNMVGFQTNLRWGEQERVFRLIPGLENAEFVRFGQMHRNTFLNAPLLLHPTLQFRRRPNLFFAGQITGVEGYVGSVATGLVAGLNAARLLQESSPLAFPRQTMLGAICHYISHADADNFQPMKANFGLLPPPDPPIRNKRNRYTHYADRALAALETFISEYIDPIHIMG